MKLESVWLDLDGTLFDTEPDIRRSYLETFRRFGIEVDSSGFKIGPPMRRCLQDALPSASDDEIERIAATFVELYDSSGFPDTVIYPGVAEWLEQLRAAGVKLFIATNKRLRPTLLILEKFKLAGHFAGVYAVDSFADQPKKGEILRRALMEHSLVPAAGVMVGDTAGDIDAAMAAGLRSCAVTWGYGSRAELDGADRLIDHPREF